MSTATLIPGQSGYAIVTARLVPAQTCPKDDVEQRYASSKTTTAATSTAQAKAHWATRRGRSGKHHVDRRAACLGLQAACACGVPERLIVTLDPVGIGDCVVPESLVERVA